MTTIVVDACFLITLDGSGNLFLLGKVKRELGWRIVVPNAVYQESTKKEAQRFKSLVDDSILERVDPIVDSVDRLARRYPMLGKGEIEAIAYVLALQDRDGVIIISDDQRAKKAIQEQQLSHLSTLDFLSRMCHQAMITKKEVLASIPRLRKVMWISDNAISSFEASL